MEKCEYITELYRIFNNCVKNQFFNINLTFDKKADGPGTNQGQGLETPDQPGPGTRDYGLARASDQSTGTSQGQAELSWPSW